MNMSVKAVEDYVKEVSRLAKSGITTEHTFRGALAVLLDQLAAGLKAFNEPKRTDCGAPDYIVQDKTGLGVFMSKQRTWVTAISTAKSEPAIKSSSIAIKPRLIRSFLLIISIFACIATVSS